MSEAGWPKEWPDGPDTRHVKVALQFTNELLAALEANHRDAASLSAEEEHEDADEETATAQSAAGRFRFPEASHTLVIALGRLQSILKKAEARAFWFILASLCEVLFQLRVWYSPAMDDLLMLILQRIHQGPHLQGSLAPQLGPAAEKSPLSPLLNWKTMQPGLVTLRLLEGVVLVCTALHSQQRVVSQLESLIRARCFPLGTTARLEAACAGLVPDLYNVPERRPLNIEEGNDCLEGIVENLEPEGEMIGRLNKAKAALEVAVPQALPGWRPEYFGSNVNGFAIKASDIDCVLLPQDKATREAFEVEMLENVKEKEGGSLSPQAKRQAGIKAYCGILAKRLADALSSQSELGFIVEDVITEARVPLVKCKWKEGGVAVDVSFNNTLPLHNSRLLRTYADFDPRVVALGRLVKHWAKQRGVNDAQQGTLSSYSHTLLVIHYLQHIGLVPNLQDKSMVEAEARGQCGQEELVDGVHDVWFVDPQKNPELVKEHVWPKDEARDATLRGLLFGFFRFWAYEFPFYSHVLNIHRPQRSLPKAKFFDDLAQEQQVQEDELAELGEEEAQREASPGGEEVAEEVGESSLSAVEETQEDGICDDDDSGEPKLVDDDEEDVDAVVFNGMMIQPEGAAANREDSPSLSPDRCVSQDTAEDSNEELKLPQKRWKLPRATHNAQLRMASKQLLCIEDPMEVGRLLGTSFNGMERLVFEWRQACYLLGGQGDKARQHGLREVFKPVGAEGSQPVRNLRNYQLYPNLFGRGFSSGGSSGSGKGKGGSFYPASGDRRSAKGSKGGKEFAASFGKGAQASRHREGGPQLRGDDFPELVKGRGQPDRMQPDRALYTQAAALPKPDSGTASTRNRQEELPASEELRSPSQRIWRSRAEPDAAEGRSRGDRAPLPPRLRSHEDFPDLANAGQESSWQDRPANPRVAGLAARLKGASTGDSKAGRYNGANESASYSKGATEEWYWWEDRHSDSKAGKQNGYHDSSSSSKPASKAWETRWEEWKDDGWDDKKPHWQSNGWRGWEEERPSVWADSKEKKSNKQSSWRDDDCPSHDRWRDAEPTPSAPPKTKQNKNKINSSW